MEKLCGEAEFIGVDGNTIYTDGSAEGWSWMGARAAYGAVCYDEAGSPMWVMRGVCGEPHPSINRAELMAVIAVLEISAGGMTIKSDSAFVVDGYERGKSYTTTSRHEAADLWRDLWARVEEMGGDQTGTGRVAIEKVKAHSTWADVAEGRVRQMDHVGNNAADKAAKEALAVAKADSPATEFNAAIARAVQWARWMMGYTNSWDPTWPEEVERAEEALAREAQQGEGGVKAMRRTIDHELWERKGGDPMQEVWEGRRRWKPNTYIWCGCVQGLRRGTNSSK